MIVSKFRKKGTRNNKKSNKKTKRKNKKSNKKTKRKNKKSNKTITKRIINKKHFLHKRGGRQQNLNYDDSTNCINPNDDEFIDDYEIIENIKINNIIVLIQNYIVYNNNEYNTHSLNIEINELEINDLYEKIKFILDKTDIIKETDSNRNRKEDVIDALNNILDLFPENN